MKINKNILLAGTGLLFVGTTMAQEQQKDSTLNRTVVVENQYNPEVMDAFKVNVLPKVEEPAVAKKHIDYATAQYPMTRFGFEPMGVMTREVKQDGTHRGYLRGSYGMLNHTDVKAAYLWDLSERDQLDVMGSFYGHSGDVDYPREGDEMEGNQRFFRTDIGLEYTHSFNKVKFNLGGNFASQVFNYRWADWIISSLPPESPEITPESNNQHFLLGNGHIGLSSVAGQTPLDFAVTLGMNTFKRKHTSAFTMPDYMQKMFFAYGTISGALKEGQRVGTDWRVSHLMYDSEGVSASQGAEDADLMLQDNTLIQLNPYYAIQSENFNIRLGAHVDIQTKVGSGLKISPDIHAAYSFSDSYVVYAQALGGTQLNDFHRLNQLSPYWMQSQQLKTSYTLFDAQAGLKASPANGLGLKLYGGYRMTKDDVFVIPDECFLGYYVSVAEMAQDKSKVFYAGAGIDYDYRDAFGISVKGQYNNWKMENKENISFLLLKPEYTINADVRFKVYQGLKGLVSYQYEARKKVAGERAEAVNFLKLGAERKFGDCLNVFVHANNILNQSFLTETGYPELGLNVIGGISFNF